MAELVQMASQLTPEVQRVMFEGLQGMAPKVAQERGNGFILQAVSSIRGSSARSWVPVAMVGISVGVGYLCKDSISNLLEPIRENTNRIREESERMVSTLIRLEESRAEEIERLNRVIETLVLERDGLRRMLEDQSITAETLRNIATNLQDHSSDYATRIDGLVELAVRQGVLSENLAELIRIQDQEGVSLHAEMLERLRAVNEIYRQLTLMFPS